MENRKIKLLFVKNIIYRRLVVYQYKVFNFYINWLRPYAFTPLHLKWSGVYYAIRIG